MITTVGEGYSQKLEQSSHAGVTRVLHELADDMHCRPDHFAVNVNSTVSLMD